MKGKSRELYTILHANATLRTLLEASSKQRRLDKIIRPLLPPAMSEHFLGSSYSYGQLVLFVDNPVWLHQLRFLLPTIRQQLQDNHFIINKITSKIQIPDVIKAKKRKKIDKLSMTNAKLLEQTADSLQDEKLSAALKRLGKHHI